jgi:hypothetical protein
LNNSKSQNSGHAVPKIGKPLPHSQASLSHL